MMTVETSSFCHLGRLVGNTPMLAVEFRFRGRRRVIYAKSEQLNMTGSIKDRMAFHILRQGYADGTLRPDCTIVEASSGNSGISFAALGRALGHKVTILMPDWMSRERMELIHSYGATMIPVSREEGGFMGCMRRAEDMAQGRADVFLPRQFSNPADVMAHEVSTGPEIWAQLAQHGLTADAFVAGVGTGGTVMGVGRYLRRRNPKVRVHALQPAESPTLTAGHKVGRHRMQGLTDEFIPEIVKLDELDEVISVSDGDSILMAQRLASELGIAVGISSGANFLGAIEAQNRLGADAVVATVFSDDNKKYLTTDLLREEPEKPGYLSPDVELISFDTYKRVCDTACEFPGCEGHTPQR
uniref:cysteine synthase n=1 Tax=Solibacter usitatus (strain Ellin6076) TaxID=234267 RepID=Q027F4_SOLUE